MMLCRTVSNSPGVVLPILSNEYIHGMHGRDTNCLSFLAIIFSL